MSSRTTLFIFLIVAVLGALSPNVLAAEAGQVLRLTNPLQSSNVIDLINAALRFITAIAIPIAVIMIIWAGIKYLTAGSNPKAIGEANNIIWSVVIGLAIIFIGRGFVDLVESVLNIGGSGTSPTPIPACNPPCTGGAVCRDGTCVILE